MAHNHRKTHAGSRLVAVLLGGVALGAVGVHQARAEAVGLEEVVVTARKVQENAQITPVAITSFSQEDLRNQTVQNAADLSNQTPSLFVTSGSTGDPHTPLMAIRGQFQTTTALSVDASVGMYLDGVYSQGTIGSSINHFLDIDRVEVLKGPQGTLYGRNTTGGAINVFTRTPVMNSFEGEGNVTFGNYKRREESAVVNVPILQDKAALRVAAGLYDHDGFGRDVLNKRDVGDEHTWTVRGALLLEPADKLRVTLRAGVEHAKDGGLVAKPIYMQPNGAANASAAAQLYGAVTPTTLANALAFFEQRARGGNFYDIYSTPNNINYGNLDTKTGSATIEYDAGPVTLKSITAYNYVNSERNLDGLAVGVKVLGNYQHTRYHEWTQELQATGMALDNKLKYAVGAYYFDLDGVDSSASLVLTAPAASPIRAEITEKSPAIYGQATYDLRDNLHITGGLRETWEKKKVNAVLLGIVGKTKGDNLSYLFGVDWNVTPQVMLYAKTGRSYKSGGFNQRMTTNPATQVSYLPETVYDFELGVKSQWFDNRLRANADVYRSDYKHIQRSAIANSGGGAPTTVTKNVGDGKIDGVEVELTALPTREIWLHATVGYTYPRYTSYRDAGFDQNFQKFAFVSKWTYSLSAAYTVPTKVGDLRGQVDYSWRSSYETDPSDSPGTVRIVGGVPLANNPGVPDAYRIQQEYGLLNASLSLKLDEHDMSIRLYGKNLTKEKYITQEVSFVGAGLGFGYGAPGDPQTYGIEVSKRF